METRSKIISIEKEPKKIKNQFIIDLEAKSSNGINISKGTTFFFELLC